MSHSSAGALLTLDRIVAIAHRGGARLRPENTLAAFDHAVSLGVDALECDVHRSSDGEVVVIHDDRLDRTTNETGPVSARTAADLAMVDAGFRFQAGAGFVWRGRAGGVPTLAEVVDRYSTVPIIVEIKGDDVDLAARTVALVREHSASSRVIIAGFSQPVLDEVRRLAPELLTSASRPEAQSAIARARFWLPVASGPMRVFQVPFHFRGRRVIGPRFVRAVRRLGLPVHAWVVDEAEDMHRLIRMGITGLISDRPDVAVRMARRERLGLPSHRTIGVADDTMMRGDIGTP